MYEDLFISSNEKSQQRVLNQGHMTGQLSTWLGENLENNK